MLLFSLTKLLQKCQAFLPYFHLMLLWYDYCVNNKCAMYVSLSAIEKRQKTTL